MGFHFDSRPDPSLHIEKTVSKVRRRYWILRHLKRHGLTAPELLQVYCSTIRSVIEFTSVVYGPMMTEEQNRSIEKLQSQCLKIIYGFDLSYRKILEQTGLQLLSQRRDEAIRKFANKCLEGNYSHWFPRNEAKRQTRRPLKFKEEFARCDRLKNTPVFTMRRVLNMED